MPDKSAQDKDRYSKALLRMGRVAPEAWPLQNAQMIRVDKIQSNPRNPRLTFNLDSLKELGESMQNLGVIEPLVVRYVGGKQRMYEIVVGERRWRAAKKIHIPELPCLVRELDDVQAFEIALSENILREELTPIDEAKCYQHMLDMGMAHSLREIARKVGVSHTRIQQKMNLMGLEREFQRRLATRVSRPQQENCITEGHARHLLRLDTTEERREILDLILGNNWSTRQTEAEVSRRLKQRGTSHQNSGKRPPRSRTPGKPGPDPEQNLSSNTQVEATRSGLAIHINYDDPEALVQELESLLHLARSGDLVETGKGPSHTQPKVAP